MPDLPPIASPNLTPDLAASGVIRFGVFEFSFSTSELRRHGILVRLQAQPAKVLSYLLSHTERVVSREELHATIWGSSTFVDFERGLNVCIAQIRAALGDESSAPRYIRTIPRKGYEFICPVQHLPSLESPGSVPLPRASRWPFVAATVALILAVGAIGDYLFAHSRSRGDAPLLVAIARFDNETGDATVTNFADALTDDVVAQLTDTADGRLRIIGNASVLRVPRQQRDLLQISQSLHAQFIVLGQVQRIGTQTRILAHLIRMPEQSHVWVVRLDQPFSDPSALEAAASREIAHQFAAKLNNPSALTALHDSATR
jgi:DNA-binding winged helix-turn-helix (wHTH) protein/TolB-like protein